MNNKILQMGGVKIMMPIPTCYRDCIELARSDYYRLTGKTIPFIPLLFAAFYNRNFRYNFWLRLSAYKGFLYILCKFMHRHFSLKHGIQISPKTLIGYGLYLGHAQGVIINPTAVIGNNVNLSQFTTIGSNEGKAAFIGDNVYIGPGVCLVENVIIGSNGCIGAGAVVTKDVPSGMTAVGVPAKIVGTNRHQYFIRKPWITSDN